MKTQFLSLSFIFVLFFGLNSFASGSAISGETETTFGTYTLTPSEQCLVIDNVAYKAWDIKYSNSDDVYQVYYRSGVEGQCCIMVRSENFEIMYAKEDGGFGAKLVDAEHRTIKKKEVLKQIDLNKLASQKVLTNKPHTEEEYLGLVACFIPRLFNS